MWYFTAVLQCTKLQYTELYNYVLIYFAMLCYFQKTRAECHPPCHTSAHINHSALNREIKALLLRHMLTLVLRELLTLMLPLQLQVYSVNKIKFRHKITRMLTFVKN